MSVLAWKLRYLTRPLRPTSDVVAIRKSRKFSTTKTNPECNAYGHLEGRYR